MTPVETATAFFRHWWSAKRWDRFHSPYLFSLFTSCCKAQHIHPDHLNIEKQRALYKKDHTHIERKDFGAGSFQGKKATSVADLAKASLSFPFQCRFLYHLVQFHHPKQILELGTSLGISAAYMATASDSAIINTIEGDPTVAELAKLFFEKNNLDNINLSNETFENYFSKTKNDEEYDLVFIDGHHEGAAVDLYFDLIKHQLSTTAIIIVDDIHWSPDMYSGWRRLIAQPEISQSVDCFQFGMLFVRKDFMYQEHHKINLPWLAYLHG